MTLRLFHRLCREALECDYQASALWSRSYLKDLNFRGEVGKFDFSKIRHGAVFNALSNFTEDIFH